MKRFIYFGVVTITLLVCCSKKPGSSYGQGGTNACQYVIEKAGIQSDIIESVEITRVDSLLTDKILDEKNLKEKSYACFEKKISEDEFHAVIQEEGTKMRDLFLSWKFQDKNDSIKKLSKYQGALSLVYTVTITTKSTAQQNIRVLMKEDGITPLMTENEFKEKMNKEPFLIKALETLPSWDW